MKPEDSIQKRHQNQMVEETQRKAEQKRKAAERRIAKLAHKTDPYPRNKRGNISRHSPGYMGRKGRIQ